MAIYTEKYVSALAIDGFGDGTEENPWSWGDAVSNCRPGMRMNCKNDDIYQPLPNEGSSTHHYWVNSASAPTPDLPIAWRGYHETIDDRGIALVQMGSGKTLAVRDLAGTNVLQRGSWHATHFQFQWANITSAGVVNSQSNALDTLYKSNQPVFNNCKFRNSSTESSAVTYAYAFSGSGVFIRCLIANAREYTTTPHNLLNNCQNGLFLGCLFRSKGQVMQQTYRPGCSTIFYRCVFQNIGTNVPDAFANVCNSLTAYANFANLPSVNYWNHCVFDGYNVLLVQSGDAERPAYCATLSNCLLRNCRGVLLESNSTHAWHYMFMGNKIWNSDGVYNPEGGVEGQLFYLYDDLANGLDTTINVWPWAPIEILSSDPLVDPANYDYTLDQDSVGGQECIAKGVPFQMYSDIPGDAHIFNVDIGAYQAPVEQPDYPDESDVRHGVVYGAHTGTCYVPLPADVLEDVPVDDTVGTLELTEETEVVERDLTFEDLTDVIED